MVFRAMLYDRIAARLKDSPLPHSDVDRSKSEQRDRVQFQFPQLLSENRMKVAATT